MLEGRIAQLVRALLLHRRGRRFESCSAHSRRPAGRLYHWWRSLAPARRIVAALALAGLLAACASIEPTLTQRPAATVTLSPTETPVPPSTALPEATPFALMATPSAIQPDLQGQQAAMLPAFQADVLQLADATRYWIQLEVAFDPLQQQAQLHGAARMRFTNPLETALPDIVLYLWPNDSQYRSSMEIGAASIGGELVEPEELLAGLAVRYPLPEPLAPGGDLDFSLPFRVEASGPIGEGIPRRFGISQGVLFAPTFYPLIPRLVQGEWELKTAPPGGDTTNSEVGFYQVEISAPADFDLVATGVEINRVDDGQGTQIVTYASGPTRDFAFALGDFMTEVRDAEGVQVRLWVLPEHEDQITSLLRAAGNQVELLSELVGPYPYQELDLVDVPGAYGGIEYPGLVSIGTVGSRSAILPVIHEVAHQWFYGLIGDDQLLEPWLDEAAATYSEVLYFEKASGSGTATGMLADFREIVRSHPDPSLPIGQAIDWYETPEDYYLFIYYKGALFFDALRAELGDDQFFAFLQAYYEAFRYRVATAADFQSIAERTCNCDLGSIFELWVYQGGATPGL